jgi:competence protein ComK
MLKNIYTASGEITPLTMAVLAQQDKDGKTSKSYVMEAEGEYLVHRSPSKLINHACVYYGASLKAKQEGTKNVCGITHKAPISIDPFSGMYFFPTTSPRNRKCSWIAHSYVEQVNKKEDQLTEIVFKNGKKISLDVSFGSMMNQIQRTAQFRYILEGRIKDLKKHVNAPEKML